MPSLIFMCQIQNDLSLARICGFKDKLCLIRFTLHKKIRILIWLSQDLLWMDIFKKENGRMNPQLFSSGCNYPSPFNPEQQYEYSDIFFPFTLIINHIIKGKILIGQTVKFQGIMIFILHIKPNTVRLKTVLQIITSKCISQIYINFITCGLTKIGIHLLNWMIDILIRH